MTLIFIVSCRKNELTNEAVVFGIDGRKCACCGGYFVKINNDTLHFFELPTNSGIELDYTKLPMTLQFNWRKDTTSCGQLMQDLIIVNKATRL